MKIFLITKGVGGSVSTGTVAAMLQAAGHTVDTAYPDKLCDLHDEPPRDDFGREIPLVDWFNSLLAESAYGEIVIRLAAADVAVFVMESSVGNAWDEYGDALVLCGIAAGLRKPIYGVRESGRQVGVMRRAVICRASIEKLIESLDKPAHAAPISGQWKQD